MNKLKILITFVLFFMLSKSLMAQQEPSHKFLLSGYGFTNLEIEIETEKSRLATFNNLLTSTTDVEQQIELTDRIFNQERRIKYLEDSLKNQGNRIDYSTITVSLNEKQSEYANIKLIKISQLYKNLINNTNSVIGFLFSLIPWAIVGFVLYKVYKRKK